jgi:hypothetical protein
MKVRRFAFGHDSAPRTPRGGAPDSGPRAVRTTIPLAPDAPRVTPTWRHGRTTVPLLSERAPAPSPARTVPLPVPALVRPPVKARRLSRRLGVALLAAAGVALYVGALFAILAPLPGTRRVRATAAVSAPRLEPPPPVSEEPSAAPDVAVSTTAEPPASAPASASAPPLASSTPPPAPGAPHAAPRRRAAPQRHADGEITNPWGYD